MAILTFYTKHVARIVAKRHDFDLKGCQALAAE